MRPGLPPESGAPKQIEHGTVFGDFAGSDQYGEDDAGLAAVYDVVGLVAELTYGRCQTISYIGVASGSVLEALESEVLFLGPLLKDRSCLPTLEIQSLPAELLRRRSSSSAVGRLRTTPSSSTSASSTSWGSSESFWCRTSSSLKRSLRWASTNHLGARESTAASASTLVASKNSSLPPTIPASTHISTILAKKFRKTSRP